MSHDLNLRLFSTQGLSTEEYRYSTVGDINIDLHRTMLGLDSHADVLARGLGVNVYRERAFHGVYCFHGARGEYSQPCPQGEACVKGSSLQGYQAPWVTVWGWEEESVPAYFVILHELGHHALQAWPSRVAESPSQYLEDETRCWEWALAQAIIPPTLEIAQLMRERWLGDHMEMRGYHWRAEQFMQDLERRCI